MKIQVGGLSEGVHPYSFRGLPTELGLGGEFREEIGVTATLEKTSRQLLLKAHVATVVDFECDRCVAQFRRPIESQYEMYYLAEEGEPSRVDPAEMQLLAPGQTVIDISDDVRQTILLALPLKHVCREDCRGLCPRCGKNLNDGACDCKETSSDGRWDKLKELQKSNSNEAR